MPFHHNFTALAEKYLMIIINFFSIKISTIILQHLARHYSQMVNEKFIESFPNNKNLKIFPPTEIRLFYS